MIRQYFLIPAFILLNILAISRAVDKNVDVLHPDQQKALAEIKGKVVAVNAEFRKLTVEDPARQRVTVTGGPDARLMNSENHQLEWSSLHEGDQVNLYYDTVQHRARQIDLLPTAAEALLGTPSRQTH